MSHSTDIRKLVLDYINSGGLIKSACELFKVSRSSIQRWRTDSVAIFETPFGTSKSPKGTKIVDKYACGSPGRPAYARYDTTRCHNFTSTNDLSTVLWALYFAFGKTSGTTVYQGLSASLLRRFLGRQRRQEELGTVSATVRANLPYKLKDELLQLYVANHPDAYLSEIAAHFGVTESGVWRALSRLKISRKKRPRSIRNEVKKSVSAGTQGSEASVTALASSVGPYVLSRSMR